MTDFGYLSEEAMINDKGRFSLPKIFHKPDEKEGGFIIFADNESRKLRITTKGFFEKYRRKLKPSSRDELDAQEYKPDEQWRGTFSPAHRKLLGNPSEVKFYGADWYIGVRRIDAEIKAENAAEMKEDMDNADELMSAEFFGEI